MWLNYDCIRKDTKYYTNKYNSPTTNTIGVIRSNVTFGNPQFIGTEYDKTTSLKQATVNGTPGFQVSFTGNGVLNGVNVTDNGKALPLELMG